MPLPALSYVHGTGSIPLLGETVGARLDDAADRWPEREALVSAHQGIRLTYRALHEQAEAFAAGLLSLGLAPGDRVGIWSHNNAEWVISQFATAKAGLILVNINPAYRLAEVKYALNRVGCRALIVMPVFKTSDYLAMLRELAPEINDCPPGKLKCSRLPALNAVIRLGHDHTPGMFNFHEIAERGSDRTAGSHREKLSTIAGELQFDDPINIQFTSGTTGYPKGATLTHHNIINNGFFVAEAMRLSEGDRLCVPVPLYHCFGMVMGNLACVTHGATIVYPAEAFDALAVLRTVHEERCTALHGVPTMFIAELEHPDFHKFDLSSLRTGIMAGAPCPIEIMKRVVSEMHMSEVTIAYGMTETSPVSFQSAVDEPLDRRVSTVGIIQPYLEAKIIDQDGLIVPIGNAGELCTRGYSVMRGYWDDETQTREAIDSAGWMHSGDLATLDEQGYCNIVGRIKDMVIRGGENIYPREIEEFLYRHPDVQEVQVVGIPDQKYGEELCAWIRLRPGSTLTDEELRAFCEGQIARYKIPRYVRFVAEFPMTVTGKVQKFKIRQAMVDELGLKEAKTA